MLGPASLTACVGGSVQFSATPTGSSDPFSYRWYRGAAELADGPSGLGSTLTGAHTGSLGIAGNTPGDANLYYCIVSSGCGDATSLGATLSVYRADFNCSSSVSVQNVFNYLQAYFTGDLRADFNQSGTVGVQDLFDFLTAYFAGCP